MQKSSIETVHAETRGGLGVLTLSRPQALNALDLAMIRQLHAHLAAWAGDASVRMVVVRGSAREGQAPVFCAGGDIRFFHRAALAGDPRLEDFFTEEYTLDFLVHTYPKPCIALMDGITMGGGMGIAQGASVRIVTERARLAMPETRIGLFPDVGGGWFLSRCPGAAGEYLALTGAACGAGDALALGLADHYLACDRLHDLLDGLARDPTVDGLRDFIATQRGAPDPESSLPLDLVDRHFSRASLGEVFDSLSGDDHPFAQRALEDMRRNSPLMMAVTLEQIRRARTMSLRECLLLERAMVRNCFHVRSGAQSETVEGIRALVIDKDQQPRWVPESVESVTPALVESYLASPWPPHAHPLRHLPLPGPTAPATGN